MPDTLTRASAGALSALSATARAVAAPSRPGETDRTMASAARAAIFADAVLGAMRSRLEELKTVAK